MHFPVSAESNKYPNFPGGTSPRLPVVPPAPCFLFLLSLDILLGYYKYQRRCIVAGYGTFPGPYNLRPDSERQKLIQFGACHPAKYGGQTTCFKLHIRISASGIGSEFILNSCKTPSSSLFLGFFVKEKERA